MGKDTVKVYNSFVFPRKRFPVLPAIFMYKMHTYDGNKYKKESHDANAPWGLHNRSNEQLNVTHHRDWS